MRQTTLQIIKTTAPLLRRSAANITTRLCEILFEEHPELRPQPGQSRRIGLKAQALTHAVMAVAMHIDDSSTAPDQIRHIADQHIPRGTTPEEYALVGQCLLRAIRDVLGDWTASELIDAWGEAYESLASVVFDRSAHHPSPHPEPAEPTPWAEVLGRSTKPLMILCVGMHTERAVGMLNVALASDREVFFVHLSEGDLDPTIREHVSAVVASSSRHALIDEPAAESGARYVGLVDRTLLARRLSADRCGLEVYFVGPGTFMANVFRHFSSLGQHLELMGGERRLDTPPDCRATPSPVIAHASR